MPVHRLGSDIGGTFTDFVLLDTDSGQLRIEKCLTTPKNPAQGVIAGVTALQSVVPGYVATTDRLFHATTLVINASPFTTGVRLIILGDPVTPSGSMNSTS